MNIFKEIYIYRGLVYNLAGRELIERYKKTTIGFFWAVLEPLLLVGMYTIIFSKIMRIDIPSYPIFLLCGLIPWLFFSKSISFSATAIQKDACLVKKVYFPREVLPLACVISRFVNFLLTFAILLMILFFRNSLDYCLLPFLIIIFLTQIILTLGFSLIFSSLNIYFQDVQLLLEFLIHLWFYSSPIIYSFAMVPEKIRVFYRLNPMVGIIEAYRNILYYKRNPLTFEFLISFVITIIVFIFGCMVFKRLNRRIGELV